MKKPVYYVILALLIGVFLFAAYKVGSYYLEKYRSDKVISDATRFVTLPGEDNSTDNPDSDPGGDPECPTVQFDELKQQNEDVIAWIYPYQLPGGPGQRQRLLSAPSAGRHLERQRQHLYGLLQ